MIRNRWAKSSNKHTTLTGGQTPLKCGIQNDHPRSWLNYEETRGLFEKTKLSIERHENACFRVQILWNLVKNWPSYNQKKIRWCTIKMRENTAIVPQLSKSVDLQRIIYFMPTPGGGGLKYTSLYKLSHIILAVRVGELYHRIC